MWNTWLEKGKELAASVDKKLNEAVGVELHGPGGSSGASTTTTASSASDFVPTLASTTVTLPDGDDDAQQDLNDAWNDDFDDDDAGAASEKLASTVPTTTSSDFPERQVDLSLDSEDNHVPVDQKANLETKPANILPAESETTPFTPEPASEKEELLIQTEEKGEWSEHQEDDDEHVEELDLDQNTPATISSAILIPALPNPIQAITSILSSPMETTLSTAQPEETHLYDQLQPEPTNEESVPAPPVPIPEPVEPEPTPPEAAWEDDLYATDDAVDEIVPTEPPKEKEPAVAKSVELSPQPGTISDQPQPPPISNGDSAHETDSRSLVDEEVLLRIKEDHRMEVAMLKSKLEEVQHQLLSREQQLAQRAAQFSELEAMHETEREELQKKIHETKEEAKKRIQKAKERVATMEERLNVALKSANDDVGSQQELVAALRAEGESLARKQSEMEKAVRAAKGEARELRETLNAEMDAKEKALEKIASLEADLKTTKDSLSAARKGESQAGKLESELAQAREDCNAKATTILSLEQQIKELKAETKELRTEVESSKRGATIETEREMAKLRKEHNEMIADLELKLRTSEREAGVREDALRHEVAELRKRWQDAVRRADALSMDVQSSTAPLLRQLESMERQNRARASAWADLETKLRAELEEHVIQNEQLSKERNELKSKHSRLERMSKEREEELVSAKATIEELTIKVERLERKLATMEDENLKSKEEWAEVERLANEGVARVRSEMTQTVVESETRYRSQIDSLEEELKIEKEKRRLLEQQVEELLANAGIIGSALSQSSAQFLRKESKPRKLRKAEGQADILAGALNGLRDDADANNPVDDDDEDDDDDDDDDNDETQASNGARTGGLSSSFAAMEQLNQRLTGAKFELDSLRKRLAESEKTREALVEEVGESRLAKDKLPLFEAKIKELKEQNTEKELEIQGLREDIAEVRELYRNQLNMLLEEKAAGAALNGGSESKESVPTLDEPPAEATPTQEDATAATTVQS